MPENRAGASPAPIIYGPGRPIRSIVGARVEWMSGVGPCGRSLGDCVALHDYIANRIRQQSLLRIGFLSTETTETMETMETTETSVVPQEHPVWGTGWALAVQAV